MKASLPFSHLLIARVSGAVACASLCALASAQDVAPAPELPPLAPPKFNRALPAESQKTLQAQSDAYYQQVQHYYQPALSRVTDKPSPATPPLYSRNVNRVTCVATVPASASGTERTWVGTRLGIKRVEKGRIVRHYTSADGLSDEVVIALAADASGAVALVGRDNYNGMPVAQTLCWWDARTDCWRALRRLSGAVNDYNSGTSGWHVLLTSTQVVLVPPQLIDQGHQEQANGIPAGLVFWSRADLQAGRDREQLMPWDASLTLQLRLSDRYERPLLYAATTWKNDVVLGTGAGLVWVPEAAFTPPLSPSLPAAPDFLPVRPTLPALPTFLPSITVSDVIADQEGLWALTRDNSGDRQSQLRRLTPVFTGKDLTGLRQETPGAPLPGSSAAQLFQEGATFASASAQSVWLLAPNGYFLQTAGGQWTIWDENGVRLGDDKPSRRNFGLSRGYPSGFEGFSPVDVPRLIAPARTEIPDAVVEVWLSKQVPRSWQMNQPAPYASQRHLAWLHQRFPAYLSPPVTLSPPLWQSPIAYDKLPSNVTFGEPWTFVRDPAAPDITWKGDNISHPVPSSQQRPDQPKFDNFLLKIPSGDVVPWQFTLRDGVQITRIVGPVSLANTEKIPLPTVSVPLHLSITGLATRADGLYLSTNSGVLRLRGDLLAGMDAVKGDINWVPRETEQGVQRLSFLSGPMYQAGPNHTLLVDTNAYSFQLAPLRWDKPASRFVPDTALPREPIVSATAQGFFTHPYRKITQEDGSVAYTQSDLMRWIPLRADGTPAPEGSVVLATRRLTSDDPPALSLQGPDCPFSDNNLQQIGATGNTIWFSGYLAKPVSPLRYSHRSNQIRALAGFDLTRKQWTRILEMPDSNSQALTGVVEEDGQTFVSFFAPDACLWQYDQKTDTWQARAPTLPNTIKPDPNGTNRVQLWTAHDGDIWLLFQQSVWHKPSGAKEWKQYSGANALFSHQRDWEPLQLAARGSGLFVGAREGLWRFDRKTHDWTEVAPLTDLLPETSVSLPILFLAADKDQVYVSGAVQVAGSSSDQGGFLLTWNKQSEKWTVVSPTALGLDRFRSYGTFHVNGQEVFFFTEGRTFRRDAATGRWSEVVNPSLRPGASMSEVTGGQYRLRGGTKLEHVESQTGKTQVLLDTMLLPVPGPSGAGVGGMVRGTQISTLTLAHGFVYLATDAGIYRFDPATTQVQAVPVPTLPYGTFSEDAQGTLYYWNGDTIAVIPQ